MRGYGVVLLLACVATEAGAQGSIRGTVRDDAGQPVAAARVTAAGRGTTSDAAGGFLLRGIPPGEHAVAAVALGAAPARVPAHVRDGEEVRVAIVLARTPLELPAVRVVGSPSEGEPAGVAQATTRLAGRALDREVGGSLAETLRAEPGVAVRSMGPGASMPVLRGLTGDRILVLHDGQRAGDLAGSADDHGTTLDPLAAQRVEVVRGPAALLYGNNALGGVVNLVSGDLPLRVPPRVEWSAAGHSASAHPGGGASVAASAPLGGGWVATGRVGGRNAGDLRLPRDRALPNTAAGSWSASAGIGQVAEGASAGAAVRGYGFAYGLPTAPGTDPVRLEGGRIEAQARVEAGGLRLNAGAQEYAHDELDAASGERLQRFALRTGTGSVQLRRGDASWGATVLVKDHRAAGPGALTPPARSRGAGVFGYRELPVGAATLQLGARLDGYHVASSAAEKFGPGHRRGFGALTGSAGVRLPLTGGVSASASLTRAFRAPSVEELFSNAAHAGTGAVELGDPGLRAERATSAELGVLGEGARWAAALSAYRTRIGGYVHLAARGDTVLYGAVLPVLVYAQAPATLSGVEASLELVPARDLVLALSGDALRGTLRGGEPLSYMPAPTLGAALRREGGRWSFGGELRHARAQRRVGTAGELPTPAYTLARLHAGLRFPYAGGVHTLTIRVDNLTDAVHREATSRTRDFAPGPGRGVSLLYRVIR